MTPEFIVFLMIGAFCGGFINGLAGFGTALFALGWWLQVMTPVQAVTLVLALSMASGVPGMLLIRKNIEYPRLARFLVPGLLGIPLGIYLLALVDANFLKLVVAIFLLIYGGYFTFRQRLPHVTGDYPVIDGTIGFVGGVLGAIAGLSGALPTMWCALKPWAKTKQRALLQPYNFAIQVVASFMLALTGAFTGEALFVIAISLPVTMIAAQLGIHVFKRLDDDQFRRLLIALMFAAGIIVAMLALFAP